MNPADRSVASPARLRGIIPLLQIIVCGAFSLLILAGTGGCINKPQQLPISADSVAVPYQLFNRASFLFYEGPHKKWKLEALSMKKILDPQGAVTVAPVRLTIYDSLGNTSSTVTADSGITNGKMEIFTVWGSVLITTREHMIVKTQRLLWSKNTHKVNSETFVQIQTARGDIMRGKGLDAVEDFSSWSFKSNVTGVFPHFKDRLEGEDQLF